MLFIYVVLFSHALADYPLQGNFLAQGKNESKYLLLMHCLIYTGVVVSTLAVVFGFFSHTFVLVLFVSHVLTDYAKTKKKITFIQDQIIHILVLLILGFLFLV